MSEGGIDVEAIVIGLDASARPEIQRAMRELAESGDTNTHRGRHRLLRAALEVLVHAQRHFTHAHVEAHPGLPGPQARARFVELVDRARARFDVEVIRNTGGAVVTAPEPTFPPSDEPGYVLVTTVVASRRGGLDPVVAGASATSLAEAMNAWREVSEDDLVAFEVVWSPAVDSDRVGAAQLEARHPEIRRLEA